MQEKQYRFNSSSIKYLIDDRGTTSMLVYPTECEDAVKAPWNMPNDALDPRARYLHSWNTGTIAYVHISGRPTGTPGRTLKGYNEFLFSRQELISAGDTEKIITYLSHENGCSIVHTLSVYANGGLTIETEFFNHSDYDVTIDMLSSFALENLSPFQDDDAPNKYKLHRFLGGWSMEGRQLTQTIEELNLEKTWAGHWCNSEVFGSKGSLPCHKYFPMAVFEDSEAKICWAAALECNSTWQIELTRFGDTFSFSGGLGDRDFCGWKKIIKKGESFKAPTAYVSVVNGDSSDACDVILKMQDNAKEISVIFNEYCTSWGKPTQEKMLSYCKNLKELGIKYAVIDAGWCNGGKDQAANGEWNVDKNAFPDIKYMTDKMRSMGIIPGIWFEFEVTTKGSKLYEPKYDFMKLKDDSKVINIGNFRTFWDFRRDDVKEHLYKKVIEFIKKNGFGYIKVDYNGNIGMFVDGEESGAEGLRHHLDEVRNFFIQIKKEIPDLVIENCASGGNRLEPSIMKIADIASFSDAHEAVEIPIIAANLHNLIRPSKELVWAVIHSDDSVDRMIYSLAATFLGRVCLSGDIDALDSTQLDILKNAFAFYQKLDVIIKHGKSDIFRSNGRSMRNPEGVQIVKRYTENEVLIVYHGFDNTCGEFNVEIPNDFIIADGFYNNCAELKNGEIIIKNVEPFTAGAVYLKKKKIN